MKTQLGSLASVLSMPCVDEKFEIAFSLNCPRLFVILAGQTASVAHKTKVRWPSILP
jgi:hypothetical protein